MKLDPFISKILLTLIIQLLITFTAMKYFSSLSPLIATIGIIVLLLLIMLSSLPIYIKFVFFTLVSILTGMMLSNFDSASVKRALFGTIGVFTSMFVLGLILAVSGYNLSGFGIILFSVLSGLFIVNLVSLFYPMSDTSTKIWSYVGLTLFSFYVVYDINIIKLNKPFGDDFVSSSVNLYLDFINIFMQLVRLK
jgi:FtsH-binding integral membrane protein